MSNSEDCGAPIGRVRCANWAASRRPAYAAISGPQHRLPVPRVANDLKLATSGIPPKACGSRTPEAGPLSCRRGSGLAICLGPLMSAGTSGAASLIPRYRRSAARVLMDEGWSECNAGQRGGDKISACAGWMIADAPLQPRNTILQTAQRSDAHGLTRIAVAVAINSVSATLGQHQLALVCAACEGVRLVHVVSPPLAPWYFPVPPVNLYVYSLRCEPSSQLSLSMSPPLKV
jgi:hypothetical protein